MKNVHLPASWCTRRSMFVSIRQRKCIFGSDISQAGTMQTRRQDPKQSERHQRELAESLAKNQPDMDIGPAKTKFYDPTEGYEPYWVGGNWVMDTTEYQKGAHDASSSQKKKDDGNAGTGTGDKTGANTGAKTGDKDVEDKKKKELAAKQLAESGGENCGAACDPVYKDYGVICGRNKHYVYKTFPQYCAMANEDCLGIKGWMIAYRGACREEPKPISITGQDVISHAYDWPNDFKSRHNKAPG